MSEGVRPEREELHMSIRYAATNEKVTNFANIHEGKEYKGVDLNNYEDLVVMLDKVRKMFQASKIEESSLKYSIVLLRKS